MRKRLFSISIFFLFVLFLSGCNGITQSNNISPEAERFIGEWESISPTYLSKIEIYALGSYLYIHVWQRGNPDHPEDYDWGIQNFEISDPFDDVIELHWDCFSNKSYDQEIEALNNGVLKVKSTRINDEQDFSYSFIYTDYFYNSEDSNSFLPDIIGMGLYQEDPEFVNLVYQLDSPQKICQYMEKNINYKVQNGPHTPYQTYLSEEGDCSDYAIFAISIAHFHGYESNRVMIEWTNNEKHSIVVYDMGDHYTYSSVYLYFIQSFNSIEACVNHCTSDYGYIISDYKVYGWDYYYRNITVR